MTVLAAARRLRDAVQPYVERAPVGSGKSRVAYILNPLDYAWRNHEAYIKRFAPRGKRVDVVMAGMNPGPWGMAQTGIPFGTPDLVSEFLHIEGPVKQPPYSHPKRPILGFDSPRTEVSGQRVWGTIRDCFGTPEAFFERFYIANLCPLVFQSETGANITPDKLPRGFMDECDAACDQSFAAVLKALKPKAVITFGKWAEGRARDIVAGAGLKAPIPVASVLHPSPASPAANRGWSAAARKQLQALGHPWPDPT